MNHSKKIYIVGGVITIFLGALIAVIVFLATNYDDDSPKTKPAITDEIPLTFTRALIVKINNSALWARDIDGHSSIFVIKNWTAPFHSFDFYRKKSIYFGSTIAGQAITSYSSQYTQLTQPGTWYANQIAVDYVHEKVYVLDGLASKINVFDLWNSYYNIITIDLNRPKDIAVDPVQKNLFILQLSLIIKANLDGSSPEAVVANKDISAFQVDVEQKRIYLATTDAIQSVDYAGQSLITLEQITGRVVSLAVSNNSLFWLNPSSDYEQSTLWFCQIVNGACDDTSSASFDDNATEIKAYNFNKFQASNPCKGTRNCEHMCIDSNDEARCVCNIGWQLKNDSESCETIDDFLVYVQGNFVKARVLDASKDAFTAAILPIQLNLSLKKKKALSLDFNARSRELVFSDDYSLSKINLKADSQQILLGGNSKENKVNAAIDWITGNVYFVNIFHGYFIHIAVANIESRDFSTAHYVIFSIPDLYTPKSLVLHPNRGILFVTLLNDVHKDQVQIIRANLDGTGLTNLGSNFSISNLENSLAIDYDEDRLFWFDKDMKTVHSADLDCSNLQIIEVSIIENPIMINVYGDYIYVSNFTSVWRIDKKTGRDIVKILPEFGYESQLIRGAKVLSKKSQVIERYHPCAVNNGDCKRYCFAKPKVSAKLLRTNDLERVCECNTNEKLDSDGKNCITFIYIYNDHA